MKYWLDWDSVPELLNKEQFCQICHISKGAALELLQSGKIPCKNNGKKTHCYEIRKQDALDYLHKHGIYPDNFEKNADCYPTKRPNSVGLPRELPPRLIKKLHSYYAALLVRSPDVFTTQDLMDLTGYSKTAINHWCSSGLLPCLYKNRTNHIPKAFIIDFFCSDYFRNINRKTKWHIFTLRDFNLRLQEERRRGRGSVKHE